MHAFLFVSIDQRRAIEMEINHQSIIIELIVFFYTRFFYVNISYVVLILYFTCLYFKLAWAALFRRYSGAICLQMLCGTNVLFDASILSWCTDRHRPTYTDTYRHRPTPTQTDTLRAALLYVETTFYLIHLWLIDL